VQDAADASGIMVTVLQLGQVVGVAAFGTVFLTALGPQPSSGGHAAALAAFGVAGATALAAVLSALRPRVGQV
jgi:hypothetical protein